MENVTKKKPNKTRLSKAQESRRNAKAMALWCGGITLGSAALALAWALYKIRTAGHADVPLSLAVLWLFCLATTVWSCYDWLHR